MSPAQYMEMQVKHALTTILTGIDDEAIPGIGNSLQFSNQVTRPASTVRAARHPNLLARQSTSHVFGG